MMTRRHLASSHSSVDLRMLSITVTSSIWYPNNATAYD